MRQFDLQISRSEFLRGTWRGRDQSQLVELGPASNEVHGGGLIRVGSRSYREITASGLFDFSREVTGLRLVGIRRWLQQHHCGRWEGFQEKSIQYYFDIVVIGRAMPCVMMLTKPRIPAQGV